jgi:hypothetical protein
MSSIPVYFRISVQAKARIETLSKELDMPQSWFVSQFLDKGMGLPTPALDSVMFSLGDKGKPEKVDVPCPNDGELVNVRCWRCGWVRDEPTG